MTTVARASQELRDVTDAELLAMDPVHIDDLVSRAVADGPMASIDKLSMRLSRVKADKASPLVQAALAIARARLTLPTSQEIARTWMMRAEELAGDTKVSDVFDVSSLWDEIDRKPQVMDGRFMPDSCPEYVLARERWVVCPTCGSAGIQRGGSAQCSSCLWRTSNARTADLKTLLTTDSPWGEVWAYNDRHLAQLRCYVSATMRDEKNNFGATCGCYDLGSWSRTLPTWMKLAKNRGRILKALDKLDEIAAQSGLAQ